MISRREAEFYHAQLVRQFGGATGLRDPGILDAALNRPFAGFGEEEFFPTGFDKAAVLMHGIITGHPFIDGNKRTGYELGRLVLQESGYDVQAPEDVRYAMVTRAATGQMDVEDIKAWLIEHSVPYGKGD
jgi:death-on-curing protein